MTQIPRTARFAFTSLFQRAYPTYLAKSPKIREKLEDFKHFKEQRPPRSLPASFKDHFLKGRLQGFRECHLDEDIILIYTDKSDIVRFIAICDHDELNQANFQKKVRATLE
jgi:addiction module RelE/StbE family toxin